MPIPAIVWIIGIALAGAAVIAFIDEIKEWAANILSRIVDSLNSAVEFAGKTIVKLIRKGDRYFRRIYVRIFGRQNMKEKRTKVWEEEIEDIDLPEPIIDELDETPELILLESN